MSEPAAADGEAGSAPQRMPWAARTADAEQPAVGGRIRMQTDAACLRVVGPSGLQLAIPYREILELVVHQVERLIDVEIVAGDPVRPGRSRVRINVGFDAVDADEEHELRRRLQRIRRTVAEHRHPPASRAAADLAPRSPEHGAPGVPHAPAGAHHAAADAPTEGRVDAPSVAGPPPAPPRIVRGPALAADDPDWLILRPLTDTELLAEGRLLVLDDPD